MQPNGAQAGTRTTGASFVPCRECRHEQVRCWRPVAEGGEWPHYIVMARQVLMTIWAFEARFTVEQPVTKRGMENLDESVPHGACWCNVRYLGADSFVNGLGHERRSARVGWRPCLPVLKVAYELPPSRPNSVAPAFRETRCRHPPPLACRPSLRSNGCLQ